MFLPTKQLPHTAPGEADVWVAEWLGVWGRLANCTYWDNHWMYLLARAVKDDWKGEPEDVDEVVMILYGNLLQVAGCRDAHLCVSAGQAC